MKPSKKLMRDFAKVVLPKHEKSKFQTEMFVPIGKGDNPCPWRLEDAFDLSDWQTVIELAQRKHEKVCIITSKKGYWVQVYEMYANGLWTNPLGDQVFDKSLPTAIMKAIVEASK